MQFKIQILLATGIYSCVIIDAKDLEEAKARLGALEYELPGDSCGFASDGTDNLETLETGNIHSMDDKHLAHWQEGEDWEDMKPNGKTKHIRYICPDCGAQSLYYDDVSVYWNVDGQEWVLSDGSEPADRATLYCGDCGNETDLEKARNGEVV